MSAFSSRREGRIVAIGLLVFFVACVYFAVAKPIWNGFSARNKERDQIQTAIDQDRQLLARRSYWFSQARMFRETRSDFAAPTNDPALAMEQATDMVSAAFKSGGGNLKSVRQEAAGSGEIHLHADAAVTLTQLVASLKILEGERPLFIIEQLTVAADPSVAASRTSSLEARIDLALPYLARHQ